MPHFRFSIKDIIDKKSKKGEDIIYHLEMDKGQSDHFNRDRVAGGGESPCYCCIYHVLLDETIWTGIN